MAALLVGVFFLLDIFFHHLHALLQKGAQNEMAKGLEEEYILNLQRQTVLLEQEIKLLKDREVD